MNRLDPVSPLVVAVVCLVVSWIVTGRVLVWLRRDGILDRPNERSSHTAPTPRGGGWGVMLTLVPAWIVVALVLGDVGRVWPVLIGAVGLVAISWVDDRRGLGPGPRFATQIAAVILGLLALPAGAPVLPLPLPLWLDRTIVALGWLWTVNLFNFMDGIDGLAGTETAGVGVALALLALAGGLDPAAGLYAAAAAGAAGGFLRWNLPPAKLFMGDVGSVPLGYTLGWLCLTTAANGQRIAAILPPLYFVADATITLLRRAARGERVWEAHREHFYQRAVRAGGSHGAVTATVAAADLVLVGLTSIAPEAPVTAGVLGAAAVAALLFRLDRWSGAKQNESGGAT